MKQITGFDPSRLLAPVPGASPAGESLRYRADYDAIREARREDDPALPQGVWRREPKRADWDLVIRLAIEVLEQRSKDLQVAAWLVEALVHRHSFSGLGQGLAVIDGLCRDFWDGLHPEVDDGDLSARAAPLEWLNGKLPVALQTLPVTRPALAPEQAWSMADYRNAQRLAAIATRDPKALAKAEAAGQVLLPAFQAAVQATPSTFYRDLAAALADGLEAVATLRLRLDTLFGREAPSLAGLRETLEDIRGWTIATLMEKGEEVTMTETVGTSPRDAEAAEDFQDGFADSEPDCAQGPIRSREEAYQRLAEAADYLYRTEPHSPTPYLVMRAVSWGSMPLNELLVELSRGRNDVGAILELLGFAPGGRQ